MTDDAWFGVTPEPIAEYEYMARQILKDSLTWAGRLLSTWEVEHLLPKLFSSTHSPEQAATPLPLLDPIVGVEFTVLNGIPKP